MEKLSEILVSDYCRYYYRTCYPVFRVYRTRRGHSQFLQSHDRDQGQHDTKTITEDSDPGQGIREPISEL